MSQVASSQFEPQGQPMEQAVNSELPSYHQVSQGRRNNIRSTQVEHTFHLSRGGHRWLSLQVHSRAEHPDHKPCFLQGQVISGSVGLDLPNAILIRSISISVSSLTDLRVINCTRQLNDCLARYFLRSGDLYAL